MDLSSPKVMGIINVTDDSFYDGSRCLDEKQISLKAEKMLKEGADILDVGGYSSRPGAKNIDENLESERVLKGIKAIRKVSNDVPISVDTFRSDVACKSIDAGAGMINDISGGNLDNNMLQTISDYHVPCILMHMVGNPQNMMKNITYNNLLIEIVDYFTKKLRELAHFGIKDVIIDVGFGFSKTVYQNYQLLNNLWYLKILNTPLLVGISRKSMIYKILETNPENSLNGTSVLNAVALIKGANMLRVHDVKEAKEAVTLINMLHN